MTDHQSQSPTHGGTTSGHDPTGSVTVVVDRRQQIVGVSFARLREDLRNSSGLAGAVRKAHTAAVLRRMATADPRPTVTPSRRRVATKIERREFVYDSPMVSGRAPRFPDFAANRDRPRYMRAADRGVPANECAAVVLDLGGPMGTLELDSGWLRQAAVNEVARAVGEAFADAYRERNRS